MRFHLNLEKACRVSRARKSIRKAWIYRDFIGMQRYALTWNGKGG